MKSLTLWFTLLLLTGELLGGTGAEGWRFDVIVKWRSLDNAIDAERCLAPFTDQIEWCNNAVPVDSRDASGLDRIDVVRMKSASDVTALLQFLESDPAIEYAEPRPIRHTDEFRGDPGIRHEALDGAPDDPFYEMQWGLHRIEAESAWNVTRGSSTVAIAVVDLGVWFDHPDLSGRRWENSVELSGLTGVDDDNNGYVDDVYGFDFVGMDGDPSPDPLIANETHGTHVAGIAAATRNNGQGISGIAPECRIMGVRVGSGGSIPYGYEGVYYACRAGAKVINCSWGGRGESAYERDIVNYVLNHGCVVVASGGNDGLDVPHFPAGLEGVISVAATGLGDNAAPFTQFGPWIKVCAPGMEILSTIVDDNGQPAYAQLRGTSMAAPFVSGVCALVASRFPSLNSRAVASRVASSCDPIDELNSNRAGGLGFGRINAWRAVADSVTGLRLGEITYLEIAGNGDGRIQAGETAELRISVMNDLSPVGNVYGQIFTTADSILLTSPTSLYGDVSEGGPYWNGDPHFVVSLPIESARARIMPLTVEWLSTNQRLLGRATRLIYLDSTFVNLDNGRMSLGFAENGSLGFYDYERGYYLGSGLHLEGRPTNALYHGSFVLAADGLVSDNAYGDAAQSHFDWITTTDSVAHRIASNRADVEVRACFDDFQAEQMLFARVSAAGLGWYGSDENGFEILEYQIVNRSVNRWNAAYAGFFMDWDLGASSTNLSHLDAVSAISYVSQVAPGHPLVGIVPLQQSWGSYYVVNNRGEIDPPADWSDTRKWQILTSGLQTSPSDPMDLSQLVSVGPFTVDSHETLDVAFALVTGADLAELRENALSASSHYLSRQEPAQTVAAVPVGLYPNPVAAGASLRLRLPEAMPATVRFYNILGRLVADVPIPATGSRTHVIDPAALNGASGLLFFRVESQSEFFSGKIFILK